MFEEQVTWAAEASADLVIAETLSWADEALLALESVRRAGLPSVVTLSIHRDGTTREGRSAADACRALADAGADVVGVNCIRGPATMLPLVAEIVAAVDVPVAALPVPYRTTAEQPSFQSLRDPTRASFRSRSTNWLCRWRSAHRVDGSDTKTPNRSGGSRVRPGQRSATTHSHWR